ncbi:hypothetical protein HPB49_017776 [Dermacentor silvarum]|uniref:Uncharacterized protein n=1 Tax=Dermacentor silvarum TaxID=543639 RepID=A0ACB8D6Y4_DERSI|nr:hypothetical protein HPB49_017776 [Dermacentor silvarum]
MPTRCVAVGCSNTYATPATSLHTFSRNQELRKLGLLAMRHENWQPTITSRLCSTHFKNEDFVCDRSLAAEVQCKMNSGLKPDSGVFRLQL